MSTGPVSATTSRKGDAVRCPAACRPTGACRNGCALRADGIVEVFSGKVEIGQGILTARGADRGRRARRRSRRACAWCPASTAASPNEGVTSGSLSVEHSGSALRYACAEARAIYLDCRGAAAGRRRRQPGGARTARSSGRAICAPATGSWPTTPARARCDRQRRAQACGGAAVRRHGGCRALDIPDKVFGASALHPDLVLPGMLAGARARARRRRARSSTGAGRDAAAKPCRASSPSCATAASRAWWRKPRKRRRRPWRSCARLRRGATGEALPDEAQARAWIKSQPVETTTDRCDARRRCRHGVARTLRRAVHAPLRGACARWRPPAPWPSGRTARLHIWSHSQGVYNLRADLALVFELPPESIVVEHVEGAGCYGQNGADDVALEAVLLARAAPGRPVQPAVVARGRDGLGAVRRRAWPSTSKPISTRKAKSSAGGTTCGATATSRGPAAPRRRRCSPPGNWPSRSRAAWPSIRRWPAAAASERNAMPLYDFPAWTITNHRLLTMPIRDIVAADARGIRQRVRHRIRSWTSWPPSAARTRWPSACAT